MTRAWRWPSTTANWPSTAAAAVCATTPCSMRPWPAPSSCSATAIHLRTWPAPAASLAFGLANHPFVDGNKRTAHVCYRVFLVLNGVELQARDEDKYIAMLGLADGALAEAAFADWIRKHLTPKPGSQLHEPEARYGG